MIFKRADNIKDVFIQRKCEVAYVGGFIFPDIELFENRYEIVYSLDVHKRSYADIDSVYISDSKNKYLLINLPYMSIEDNIIISPI